VIKYKKSSKYKRFLTILEETHGLIEKDLERMSYIGGSFGYHATYFKAKFYHIEKKRRRNRWEGRFFFHMNGGH